MFKIDLKTIHDTIATIEDFELKKYKYKEDSIPEKLRFKDIKFTVVKKNQCTHSTINWNRTVRKNMKNISTCMMNQYLLISDYVICTEINVNHYPTFSITEFIY